MARALRAGHAPPVRGWRHDRELPSRASRRESASIPLGQRDEVGFANCNKLLVLTLPQSMAGRLRQRLSDAIVRGPENGLSMDGSARVAEAWVRLRHTMRASPPLGALGDCGVEAG